MRAVATTLVLLTLVAFGCRKNEMTTSPDDDATENRGTLLPIDTIQPCTSPIVINVFGDGFKSDESFEAETRRSVVTALTRNPFNNFCFRIQMHRLPGPKVLGPAPGGKNACWYVRRSEAVDAVRRLGSINVDNRASVIALITNEGIKGGCAEGHIFFIDTGTSVHAVKHELGHAIGGLYDEYAEATSPCTGCSAWRNCISDRSFADWGEKAVEGCDECASGKFRPEEECAMNTNTPDFCFVCDRDLRSALKLGDFPLPQDMTKSCPIVGTNDTWEPHHTIGRQILIRVSKKGDVGVLGEVESNSKGVVAPRIHGTGLIGVVERRTSDSGAVTEEVVGAVSVADDVYTARSYGSAPNEHEIRVRTDSMVVAVTVYRQDDGGPVGDLRLKTLSQPTAPSRPVFDMLLADQVLADKQSALNLGAAWDQFRRHNVVTRR